MELMAMSHYFIVKIEIEKQKERKEKIGSLYLHATHTFMERNLQVGEVVSIGSIAATQFREVKVGNLLLLHHFVENDSNKITSCEKYNYYNVTASEYNGRRNESYGTIIDGEIIPHPDFVFIKTEKKKEIEVDNFEEENTEQVGSLILFKNWEEKREDKENKAKELMAEIKNQSKGKSMKDDVKIALEEKQYEAGKITASLNKREYKPYPMAFYNPLLQKSYNKNLKECTQIYCLNIAAQTTIEVLDKEYIIVQSKYVVSAS